MNHMIEKFRYFLFFTFLAFFSLKGFSQAVGTPYNVPNVRGTSLTFVKFPNTGRDTIRTVSTEIYVNVFCGQGTIITSIGGAEVRIYCKLPLTPGTILYLSVGGLSTNNIAVNGGDFKITI